MSGKATLSEIEQHWSIEDLLVANQFLDLQEAAEDKAERNRPKGGR